jgi:hypothetical protein
MRRHLPPPPVPTLGDLHQAPGWATLHCNAAGCHHSARFAFAPYVIRWGKDASSDMLRQSARCSRCGGKGARITMASWEPGRS